MLQVTLHYEETESEVKVETMGDEPERIKCFPIYTILLALNQTKLDLLSLGCQGQELEILQTSKSERNVPIKQEFLMWLLYISSTFR